MVHKILTKMQKKKKKSEKCTLQACGTVVVSIKHCFQAYEQKCVWTSSIFTIKMFIFMVKISLSKKREISEREGDRAKRGRLDRSGEVYCGSKSRRPLNSHCLVVRLKILSVISRSHYRATKSHYFTKTSQDFKQIRFLSTATNYFYKLTTHI